MALLGRVEPGTTYWATVFPGADRPRTRPLAHRRAPHRDRARCGRRRARRHRVGDQQLGRSHRRAARGRGAAGGGRDSPRRRVSTSTPASRARCTSPRCSPPSVACSPSSPSGARCSSSPGRARQSGDSLLRRRGARGRISGMTAAMTPGTPVRRRHRDPARQSQQVRVRPRAARDPARPPPLLGHGVPVRLRLRPRHARARRRSPRRAGAPRGPDVPRLLGGGAGGRRVLDGGREGARRQDPLRPVARPELRRGARHRRPPEAACSTRSSTSSTSTRCSSPRRTRGPPGYEGRDAAYAEIEASRLRFQSSA